MRVSACVGDYAKTPYCVPGAGINVFCMEELCYCVKENAFLLDSSLLNDGLLNWIERECGLKDLAKALYPLVHKQGSLSAFVAAVLQYVGFYDDESMRETESILKQSAGLSGVERRKSQVDYLVRKKKYKSALAGYEELLQNWKRRESKGESLPAVECLAAIWHNKGVAYTGLMLYGKAAECFRQAYELSGTDDDCMEYLAAKRIALSEEDYVAFAAEHKELYQHTLELEKRLEQYTQEWEQQPDYLRLYNRRELRYGGERQRYYQENECLVQALKDNYRGEV